jgi:hypothetical protein
VTFTAVFAKLNNMNVLFASLATAKRYFGALLLRYWYLWVPLTLVSGALSLLSDLVTEQRDQVSIPILGLTVGLVMTVGLVVDMIIMAVVALKMNDWIEGHAGNYSWQVLKRLVAPLTIETLRALARILLWACLFIVPGMYWYLRYQFVSYVVLFDPSYAQGKVDALIESGRVADGVKRYLLLLFLISILVEVGGMFLLHGGAEMALLGAIIKMLVDIYCQAVTFALYKHQAQTKTAPAR